MKSKIILVIIGLIFVLLLPFIFAMRGNDKHLEKFASNLYNYPLPKDTKELSRTAEVGLMGNGNHCDFLVTQKMSTKLSPKEIQEHYEKAVFPFARDDFYPPKSDYPVKPWIKFDEESTKSGDLHYTVKIMDSEYPAGFDIRCH